MPPGYGAQVSGDGRGGDKRGTRIAGLRFRIDDTGRSAL
jgi:hypothetical protein